MRTVKQFVGISLIEILISLIILVALFVVLLQFHSELFRKGAESSQHIEAQTLAMDKLNELRHYSVLDTTAGFTAYDDIASGTAVVTQDGTLFTITWTVTEITTPPHKQIKVLVAWSDQENVSHSVQMNGIIGKIDPANSGSVMESL